MSDDEIKYGVLNEDYFLLRSPRAIDGDEHSSLDGAMREAAEMIADGVTSSVSVVRCRYSLKHGVWFEVPDGGCIQIEGHNWKDDDEFRSEREARRKARALVKQSLALAKSKSQTAGP